MILKNTAAIISLLVFILGFSTFVKVCWNAREELQVAERYARQNQNAQAAVHYERSIHWFVPVLDFQCRAAEGLWKIARDYEARGDTENALGTYRLLRGAFYSVRSFYTPGKQWIERSNERIATLMAMKPESAPAERTQTFDQRRNEILSLLSREKPPRPLWALLTELGFFGWVTCSVLFIFKAMTKSGGILLRPALFWTGGFVVFYSLWILGMFNV
ncbi:MAG: hypothetical protein ACE5E9_04260 [Nitrospinaceae bacterium]